MTIGLPHLSQTASVSRVTEPVPSGPRSRVFLHVGYLEQPRNQPFFDHRFIISPSWHSEHVSPVGSGSGFQRLPSLPASTSSSSASMLEVNVGSMKSRLLPTSPSTTNFPSSVGRKRASSFST